MRSTGLRPGLIELDPDVRRAFARDASGIEYIPEGVARPSTALEVSAILATASSSTTAVTPAGAQTSYVASAISEQGIVLSLRKMAAIIDVDVPNLRARVEPGVILGDLNRQLAPEGLFFAPDPTSEDDCTVGGAIATNASGARSLKYGAVRRHVRGLRVALPSGEVIELRRSGVEKNTAGFYPAQNLVDWFIGSEGTLGVVVEAELALMRLPREVSGFAIPFPSERDALEFVVAARESREIAPRCLEFFDADALDIARSSIGEISWASGATAMIYAEEEDGPDGDKWLALAEAWAARVDDIRVFQTEADFRTARKMRHAVPSTMNERASRFWPAGGRKVSTDWAVPLRSLERALSISRQIAHRHGIEAPVTFGHAGNGHPHQNYLAESTDRLRIIDQALEETLREVIGMGGTVAAEHGIGKLKKRWLGMQATPYQLSAMAAMKRVFDPTGIMSPGNVL
jgi:FAD/FMN-containing dehydrogenase